MRSLFVRWQEFSHTEQTQFFEKNMGSQATWNTLRKELDWPFEDLQKMVDMLVEDKKEVVEFMGGEDALEALPPSLRHKMLVLSSMRLVLKKNGVDWISQESRDKLVKRGRLDKTVPTPRKGSKEDKTDDLADSPVTYE